MSDQLQTFEYGYTATSAAQRNRVLRNTYVLLALSMIPTVLGAWIGIHWSLALSALVLMAATLVLLSRALRHQHGVQA